MLREGALVTALLGNRAAFGEQELSGQDFGFYISTRQSDGIGSGNATNQHRSAQFQFRNTPPQDRTAGIVLRFTPTGDPQGYGDDDGDAKKQCYMAALIYDGASQTFSVEIRHYTGTGQHIVIASAATAALPSAVTFNALLDVDFECQSTDPPNLRPAMRLKIDGNVIALTAQVAGVDVFGDWLVDGRGNAIKSAGAIGEGFYFQGTAAATPRVYVDTWAQQALTDLSIDEGDPDPPNPDDYASIPIRGETTGKTGTLLVPASWSVRQGGVWYRNEYTLRSGHEVRHAVGGRQRRSFQLQANGANAEELEEFLNFLESHRGSELPFDWRNPRTGEVIPVRFATPASTLSTLQRGIQTFTFDLVEAFSGLGDYEEATASFDTISKGAGPAEFVQFYDEDALSQDVDLTINLDKAAPAGGLQVAYKVSGNAIEGTDYTIFAGASPLTFAADETSKTVTVRISGSVDKYRLTREINIDLDTENSDVAVNSLSSGVRMRIKTPKDPPRVQFTSTSGNVDRGDRINVPVEILSGSNSTGEDILVRWKVTGGDMGSEDYDIPVDFGDVIIPAGSTSTTIPVDVAVSAASNETLILDLNHESDATHLSATDPNGRQTYHEDENFATYVDDLRFVQLVEEQEAQWQFAGTPADYARGPAGCLNQTFRSGLLHTFDPVLTTDRGTPMNVLYAKPGTPCAGYHRKDFAKEVSSDGPTQAQPFRVYQRFSIKVKEPTAQAPVTGYSSHIRMSIFDRQGGFSYAISFTRSGSTWSGQIPANSKWGKVAAIRKPYTQTTGFTKGDIGRQIVGTTSGNTGIIVDYTTGGSKFVFIDPDPGSTFTNNTEAYTVTSGNGAGSFNGANTPGYGSGEDSAFGVATTSSGETVLWILHHEVTKTVGDITSGAHNRIIYPVADGLGQDSSNWDGLGVAIYDHRLEYSDTLISGAPLEDYFPKLRDWWEPIGNATLNYSPGGNNQYTITVN
jgi:hypothetical protein